MQTETYLIVYIYSGFTLIINALKEFHIQMWYVVIDSLDSLSH